MRDATSFGAKFEDGWVWMIPLKGDLYSVGLVVDRSKADEVKAAEMAERTEATRALLAYRYRHLRKFMIKLHGLIAYVYGSGMGVG